MQTQIAHCTMKRSCIAAVCCTPRRDATDTIHAFDCSQPACSRRRQPARYSRPHTARRDESTNAGFRRYPPTPRQSTTVWPTVRTRVPAAPSNHHDASSPARARQKSAPRTKFHDGHPVQVFPEHFYWNFSTSCSTCVYAFQQCRVGIPSPERVSDANWRALHFWRSRRGSSAKKNTRFLSVTFLPKKAG